VFSDVFSNSSYWNSIPTTKHQPNFSRKYGSITRDRLLLDVTNKYGSITRDRLLLDVTNKYGSITRDRLLLDVTNKYGSITRDRLLLDVTNKYGSITRDRLLLDVTNKYGSITRDRLLLDVTNKSSLDLYQYFYIKQGKQVYLDNQNDFKASRLNLLARTKTIPLQKNLCRMNLSGEMTCPLCKTDTIKM
jgi:hypothetical protein